MLGGETIAEAGAGGTKHISYVRVGTSILAHLRENYVWQQGGGYSYNAVYYEHRDASGMSYRMTKRQMAAAYGDYTDERQAEFDAGGTNVGLVTTNNPIYGEPPENPIPLEAESVLSVDGQRVTCDLDGLAISCSQVRNRLENGSAVPPLIDEILRAAGGRDINLQYSGGGRFTFRDFNYDGPGRRSIGLTFNFLINFFTQSQTQQPIEPLPTNLRGAVETRLNDGDCRQFLNDLLAQLGAKDKNIDSLFGDVEKIGGPVLVRNLIDFGTPADGISYYGKKNTIGINAYFKRDKQTQSNQIVQRYITTIFHELIHRGSGKGDHRELARAAFSLLSVNDPNVEALPTKQTKPKDESLDTAFSRYLDRRINDKCKYDPNLKPGETK